MTMSAAQADENLNRELTSGTPHVVLHTGSPGAAGTANVALDDADAAMAPKPASFAAPGNHPTNIERRVLSNAALSFSGAELKAGQNLTHFSVWDGADGPGTDAPLYIAALAEPKTTGSDGAAFASGDIEVAIEVFAKP